jgi:hypothetical protein
MSRGSTALMSAVERGDISHVKQLINTSDLEATQYMGNTALILAAMDWGDRIGAQTSHRLCRILLDANADITQSNGQHSVLTLAVRNANRPLVQMLLDEYLMASEHEWVVGMCTPNWCPAKTAIAMACCTDDRDILLLMLECAPRWSFSGCELALAIDCVPRSARAAHMQLLLDSMADPSTGRWYFQARSSDTATATDSSDDREHCAAAVADVDLDADHRHGVAQSLELTSLVGTFFSARPHLLSASTKQTMHSLLLACMVRRQHCHAFDLARELLFEIASYLQVLPRAGIRSNINHQPLSYKHDAPQSPIVAAIRTAAPDAIELLFAYGCELSRCNLARLIPAVVQLLSHQHATTSISDTLQLLVDHQLPIRAYDMHDNKSVLQYLMQACGTGDRRPLQGHVAFLQYLLRDPDQYLQYLTERVYCTASNTHNNLCHESKKLCRALLVAVCQCIACDRAPFLALLLQLPHKQHTWRRILQHLLLDTPTPSCKPLRRINAHLPLLPILPLAHATSIFQLLLDTQLIDQQHLHQLAASDSHQWQRDCRYYLSMHTANASHTATTRSKRPNSSIDQQRRYNHERVLDMCDPVANAASSCQEISLYGLGYTHLLTQLLGAFSPAVYDQSIVCHHSVRQRCIVH